MSLAQLSLIIGNMDELETENKSSIVNAINEVVTLALSKANEEHNHVVEDITNFPELANVALSGDYEDLNNTPTIPTVINNLTSEDTTEALSAAQGKILKDELTSHKAENATENNYGHIRLSDIPIPTVATQAEAKVGTNNTKIMTPLRVKETIEELKLPGTQIFLNNGTFKVPSGVNGIFVTACGGGGGGKPGGGGGGGGACILEQFYIVTPGSNIAITVGRGGASGTPGSATIIGNLVTLSGGGTPVLNGGGASGGYGGGGGGGEGSDGEDGLCAYGGVGFPDGTGGGIKISAVSNGGRGEDSGSTSKPSGGGNGGYGAGGGGSRASGGGGGGGGSYGGGGGTYSGQTYNLPGGKGGDGIVIIKW